MWTNNKKLKYKTQEISSFFHVNFLKLNISMIFELLIQRKSEGPPFTSDPMSSAYNQSHRQDLKADVQRSLLFGIAELELLCKVEKYVWSINLQTQKKTSS